MKNWRILPSIGFGILLLTQPLLAGESSGEIVAVPTLTMAEAVKIALRQNREILKAKQEIERTHGVVIEVRAKALPRVNLTSTYNQQDKNLLESSSSGSNQSSQTSSSAEATGEGATTSGDTESEATVKSEPKNEGSSSIGGGGQDKSWRVAIEANQTLYSGGQLKAALKIAEFSKQNSFYGLRDTIDRIISQVRTQFYEVLLNRALITVQEESIELLGNELENQRNRFEAGTVPHFNVLRAEVELANTRPELIRAKNNYRSAQLNLARTLALDQETQSAKRTFNVVGDLDVIERPMELSEALMFAKARRAFLKVQRQNILIEAEQIKVVLAGYHPRLEVRGGYETRNSRLSRELDDTVHGWFFGIAGNWTIFDGLETSGKLMQQRARLETARINYEDSVQQVELEVQEALARMREARELIESQLQTVTQANEALRLARERLSAGAGTQLDVLDARVALTRARVTELRARYDYNVALAQFDRATGAETEYAETFDDPLILKKVRLEKQTSKIKKPK